MNIILLASQYGPGNNSTLKPLGCYQLASWLRQHGYSVKVIDHCSIIDTATLRSMISRFIDSSTVAIGVTSTFWGESERFVETDRRKNFTEPEWVLAIREALEQEYSNLEWLLGGPSASYGQQLKYDWHLFVGNAEDSLLSYMDTKFNKKETRHPFDICSSTMQYHETDFIQSHESLAMELGRGCQFKCKFCQYPHIGKKKGTYLRSIDCIRNDLLYNYEHFGTTRYSFLDDTVNEDYDKIVALANMAQKLPFELEWAGYNRIDLIWSRPETIQILKDSGLKSSQFGIESFNAKASRFVGKGWFGKYSRDFILELREKWGKEVSFFMTFIAGLDDESEQELFDTANWLIKNKFYSWSFSPLRIKRILPSSNTVFKSEFERNAASYGYRFPKPLNDNYWETDRWNANQAIEVADACNKKLDATRLRILAGFTMFELPNLGYKTSDILWKHLRNYDIQDVINRRNNFLQNYIDATMAYNIK